MHNNNNNNKKYYCYWCCCLRKEIINSLLGEGKEILSSSIHEQEIRLNRKLTNASSTPSELQSETNLLYAKWFTKKNEKHTEQ